MPSQRTNTYIFKEQPPDVKPRCNGPYRSDETNYSRLDNAVFKIGMFWPKLEVFFKWLDNDGYNHVDYHEYNEKDEQVVPKVCGERVDEKLIVEVAGAEERAWQ